MFAVRKPKYGLEKIVYEIEDLFLNSPYFRGRMYFLWLSLPQRDKDGIKREIKKIIQRELLGEKWVEALAKDIIQVDSKGGASVDTSSYVYKYLKAKVFRGDVKKMLIVLNEKRGLEDA